MSAKHTAGPWTHEGQGDITGVENDHENGCVGLVDVACVYLRTVPCRTEANARLIAAAPDLLAALRSAHHMLTRDYIDDAKMAVIEKCDAAIASATGEAP